MSTTHYSASRSAVATEAYVRGTDDGRSVAITCDVLGGPGRWSRVARAVAKANGRAVEALHYRQSFDEHEFDPSLPADCQRVNDLGYLLAKKMHPHSDVLVVTHNDGKGGKLHNHVLVTNHDKESGKALSNYRTFLDRPDQGGQKGVRSANDELSREHGLQVVPTMQLAPKDWELRRESFAAGSLDREMGDRFQSALNDRRCTDKAGLLALIDEQNQRATATQGNSPAPAMRLHSAVSKKSGAETWTLYIQDLRDGTHRAERRKRVTQLSADFTPNGAQAFFDYHQRKKDRNDVRSIEQTDRDGPPSEKGVGHGGGSAKLATARIALARLRGTQTVRSAGGDGRRAHPLRSDLEQPEFGPQPGGHGRDDGGDAAELADRQRSRQLSK
jgi:hypothetical protein